MMHDTTPGSSASDAGRGAASAGRALQLLSTGVPGLDAVLGGGLPAFSFNMLAGGPGAGKTTLAQQIMFANATLERPALYFTVLGEPTVKMLRYQQQFRFFRPELVGSAVHYLNLSEEVSSGDLATVLQRITRDVEHHSPGLVIVDSFRTMRDGAEDMAGVSSATGRRTLMLETFVQRLALHLTTWEVTSLLIGEYTEAEQRQPLFTIADGILWLSQATDRNSVVRQLQVVKVRGRAQMPGLHTFRITDDGLQVFPRIPEQQWGRREGHPRRDARLSTGVPGLDPLLGGGIPAGDAVLLAGATGTGKSTMGMLFAAEGLRRGEAVVVAAFEEYPTDYLSRLGDFDVDPDAMVASGRLRVTYLRPLDLSVDEALAELLANVRESGATRVVIDSLTGFEVALAPAFREDFRESLYRLVGALTATGVTVFMVQEAVATSADLSFSGERVSFITDDIIVQRYVELDGVLQKVLSVVKMRRSSHSQAFWRYHLTRTGAVIGEPLVGFQGILTGNPEPSAGRVAARESDHVGLTQAEAGLLDVLVRSGEATLDALATSAGVARADARQLVERLVALDYAVRLDATEEAGESYRAVARAARP
jgi:circadian clock protein KaiC